MILSDEHDDCRNWARWVSDNDPRIGYPRKWSLPDGPDWHMDEDKHDRELELIELGYDERRAVATDGLFRIWLDPTAGCRISPPSAISGCYERPTSCTTTSAS